MKKKEKIKVLQINLLNSLIENTHLKTQLKEQEDKYKNDLFSYSEGVVKRVSEKMAKKQKLEQELKEQKELIEDLMTNIESNSFGFWSF